MTAPVFHRLTVPSYFGGLPSNYDYINNLTSGTPAFADVQKSSGVNVGTYFVAFGENGTSADANRSAQALSTNTDWLDNLMHADLVTPVRTADVGPIGGPVATITLTGTNSIWLGNSGGYLLKDLFHITDSNDRDIEVSGTQVAVASFTGGTVGSGFAASGVVLTLTVSIPTGTTYHVYYGLRNNLASLGLDSLSLPLIRNLDSVNGAVVDFVSQISSPHALGNAVAGLQAYRIQGPDGTRLAKSASLYFDADPADSGATVRSFVWTTRHDTVDRELVSLFDDPTSSLFTGLTGLLRVDAGVALGSLGTLFFEDLNTFTGGPPGVNGFLALSGASDGDAFPRVMETVAGVTLGTTAPSLLRLINGRWACTCGDGVSSFGDFNGAGALDAALTYAAAQGLTSLHIQLKMGAFTLSSSHPLYDDTVIEGVDTGQTVITTAVTASTTLLFVGVGGFLRLKNLTFTYGTGEGVVILIYGAVELDGIALTGLQLSAVNANTYNGIAAVLCKNCAFSPGATMGYTIPPYAIVLAVGNGAPTHAGFIFQGCSWTCPDETGPVQIAYSGASAVTTISGVLFRDCAYTLGGTATTSSHLTTNTGVLTVNPSGYNNLLIVNDVTWENCNPTCVTSADSCVLARIYPIGLGDNSTSHLAVISSLTIKGGTWTGGDSTTGYAISPFLLAAASITVEDVTFVGALPGLSTVRGPSSEDQYIVDGVAHASADWAQFVIATGAQSVTADTTYNKAQRLVMRGVVFERLGPSAVGDLWLYLNGCVAVDGITLRKYSTTGVGGTPNARVRLSAGNTTGYLNGIAIHGNAGGAQAFTNTANVGQAGMFVVNPASNPNTLRIAGLSIENFTYSTTPDDGVVLVNPTTGTPSWRYWFDGCSVLGLNNGLVMYGLGTSGSGGNGWPLDGLSITGGTYSNGDGSGISLRPDEVGFVWVDKVTCRGNAGMGLLVTPYIWGTGTTAPQMVTVTNNIWTGNNSDGTQASFLSGSSSDHPHVTLRSNAAFTSVGVVAGVQIQIGASGALPASGLVGSTGLFVGGAHTGISGVGSGTVGFTDGDPMMENLGILKTPS